MFRTLLCTLYRTRRPRKLPTYLKDYFQQHKTFTTSSSCLYTAKHNFAEEAPKPHRSTESTYAYKILQTIPVTAQDLFHYSDIDKTLTVSNEDEFNQLLDNNWRNKTASEIVNAFKSVSSFCCTNSINVSDERFDKLVDGLMDNVQNLTDNELSDLITCLASFPPCENYASHNFHDIWSALDDVCCWHVQNWTRETMFWFADLWYRFNLGHLSDFMYIFLTRMDRRIAKLTKHQLVHVYFYSKLCKRKEIPFEYQSQLDLFKTDMSIEELTVPIMMLARNKIKPKLDTTCEFLMLKIKENMSDVHEIFLQNTLEVLRYSSSINLVDQMMDLLDHLVPEIDRLSVITSVHAALLGTTLQFFHKESLEKISQKIVNELGNARFKDLERILVALTMFNFDPKTTPDIYTTIFHEIHKPERIAESVRFQRCLPSILNFLSIRGMYSYELLDHILHPDYIREMYGKNPRNLGNDSFSLDVSIDVECPDYKGNRLEKALRQRAAKWRIEYIPQKDQPYKLTWMDKFFLEVLDIVCSITPGSEYVHCHHLLPNYVKADIIVCKDANDQFVKPVDFEQYTIGDIAYPTNKSYKWYAIVLLSGNMSIRGTNLPLGLYNMKQRQLKLIGYTPVFIIANEFTILSKDEKFNYIASRCR